jgi:hypothetical protein
MTVTNSTISGNTGRFGGGIYITYSSLMVVTGSTISGNSASGSYSNGGGIKNRYGNLTVTHSTITGNSAEFVGGGIWTDVGGSTELSHAIVAGNTQGASIPSDVSGGVTLAFSLVGVDTDATIVDNGGNLIGTAGSPIDPLLGPLADNGGPTLTHTLSIGSPAIDAGDPAAPAVSPGTLVSQNLGRSAYSASQWATWAPEAAPEFSFDGIIDHGWNAGGYPMQWLEVDLQQPQALTSLRLYVEQLPDANTIHQVWVSNSVIQNDLSGATLIHTFAGFTAHLDVLTYTLPSSVSAQFVQVRTTESPSWVAWQEVQVFADVPLYDQRGVPFTRVYDGDGTGGPRIDIGAFESQPIPAAFYGDYNQNGVADTADYTVWRDTLGQSGVTPYSGADGNGNGIIDKADYRVWKSHFGDTLPGSGSVVAFAQQPPALPGIGAAAPIVQPQRVTSEAEPASREQNPPPQPALRASLDATRRRASRLPLAATPTTFNTVRDDALVAWLSSHDHKQQQFQAADNSIVRQNATATNADDQFFHSVDQALARYALL